MRTLSNAVEAIEKIASMVLIGSMALVLFFNVVYRYFLNDPIFWANEASMYMMAWATFLSGSLGLKYKSQASITLLVNRFKGKNRRVINIVSQVIMLIFVAYLIYISFYWILNLSGDKSSSMRIPMWIPYSCIPVGLSFAFIHLLSQFFDLFRKGDDSYES